MSKYFRNNIRAIRKNLNLSVKAFAELTGVSPATIVNIEQNHKGLKFDTMQLLVEATDFTVEEVSSEDFKVPINLREQLFAKNKENMALRVYFMKRPKIREAIDHKLIESEFFKTFREINEIVDFFADFGWQILGTSLQNELKIHDKVDIKPHSTKKNTNVYRRK